MLQTIVVGALFVSTAASNCASGGQCKAGSSTILSDGAMGPQADPIASYVLQTGDHSSKAVLTTQVGTRKLYDDITDLEVNWVKGHLDEAEPSLAQLRQLTDRIAKGSSILASGSECSTKESADECDQQEGCRWYQRHPWSFGVCTHAECEKPTGTSCDGKNAICSETYVHSHCEWKYAFEFECDCDFEHCFKNGNCERDQSLEPTDNCQWKRLAGHVLEAENHTIDGFWGSRDLSETKRKCQTNSACKSFLFGDKHSIYLNLTVTEDSEVGHGEDYPFHSTYYYEC